MQEKVIELKIKPVKILLFVIAGLLTLILFLLWLMLDHGRWSKKTQNEFGKSVQSAQQDALLDGSLKDELNLSNKDPEVGGIVEKVSRHMLLPSGDITVSNIIDAEKLRSANPFLFQFAKNGDRLILHPLGFIIYDAQVDKIVDAMRVPQASASDGTTGKETKKKE